MRDEIPAWAPLSDAVLADQRAAYDEHRTACPVARGPRGVTVFRHADVMAVATDPERFSSAASAFRSIPNTLDPPEHGLYRPIVDAFFTPSRMAALEPAVRRAAREVVAGLPEDDPVDAVTEIGYPFAVRSQALWLGWEGSEAELLRWMADNHAATRSGDTARTAEVAAAFDAIVSAQLRRRRELGDDAPDDPTTELSRLTVQGRPLTDAEIVSILRNWTAGDLGSIAACLGVVIHHLATHPQRQDALRADPSELTAAVDEMLRIDDPFVANRRVTTGPTEVAGFRLAEGERLYLNWTSANRDEAVFGDPDAYRPTENAADNIVWGVGIHVCPGRPLAMLELVTLTEELLSGWAAIAPDPAGSGVRETYPVGGWRTVPVRLGR